MYIDEDRLRSILREELIRFNRPAPIGEGLPETLTTKDVAHILGMHPKTVRAWANEGKLNFRRFGKKYLFNKTYIVGIAKTI